MAGGWRRMHVELHNLYASPDVITVIKSRSMRWVGHVARMGETRKSYSILNEKPERKRQHGITKLRLGDNIKMDLREMGWEDAD
jgi:hypothetical protein